MRKTTRRRRRPVHNPMAVALTQATVLSESELLAISVPMHDAFDHMRQGKATVDHWCILTGCLHMANTIEAQGVVRGLGGHFRSAGDALTAIGRRGHDPSTDTWRSPTLYGPEIEALNLFVELHEFQLQQLSYREFRRAYLTTRARTQAAGFQVVAHQPEAALPGV